MTLAFEPGISSVVFERMPKQVAVAWSGGVDSTALLWLLKQQGFDVQAWHVDHSWHKNSPVIAQKLKVQAQTWGIPFYSKKIEKPPKNLESASRKSRYEAFHTLAHETGCFHVVLAHHADDQAETVFMRLLQGAGVAGCMGMRSYRVQESLHLWRPMLGVRRYALLEMLRQNNIQWHDDPSNEDTTLWRNKIRKLMFAKMRESGGDPVSLFLRWQAQAVKIQQQIEFLVKDIMVEQSSQDHQAVCSVNWMEWTSQPQPVRAYLLQRMIGLLFADGVVMGRRHILAVEAWREQGGNNWLNLSGCCLYRKGEDLQLCQGKLSLRSKDL